MIEIRAVKNVRTIWKSYIVTTHRTSQSDEVKLNIYWPTRQTSYILNSGQIELYYNNSVYAQIYFYAISYANLHMEPNKKHTIFSPGPHTTIGVSTPRHFQPYANRHIASHTASMTEVQYRNVA